MQTITYTTLNRDDITRSGLIVLQSDVTIEDEFRHFFADTTISLLVSRIPFANAVTAATLTDMEEHLSHTMALFPLDEPFDVMGYACTSGALQIGHQRIGDLVNQARPCGAVTDPLQAVIAAFKANNINQAGLLAPYSVAIAQGMVDALHAHDITVTQAATFDQMQDRIVGMIDPESVYTAACDMARNNPHLQAVFIACTNLKSASVITAIEQATGLLVVSSNLALSWHMAQLAGIAMNPTRGRLFSCHI